MSGTGKVFTQVVKLADSHYGMLDAAIATATTPQELVDGLGRALNTLREWQLKAHTKSDACNIALRITRITSFIDQMKYTFEGEVQ